MIAPPATLRLIVVCLYPPTMRAGLRFGLQDKARRLHPGESLESAIRFTADATVKRLDGDRVNIGGAFAHGTPDDRFLYLTLQRENGDDIDILKRLKIPLTSIRWPLVAACGGVLQAHVDGRNAATVALLGEGWAAAAE